ncbi:hypothetical protein [Streptomyces cellostaticus]|uniref:hypothetical protein n=1 Tax=Streptomyces TaxID=1883 RepID=UPI002026CF82|nr:hypothetical protein [Streptomyces cellostaticus]
MITQVSHSDVPGTGPAALTLPLAVARELHAPAAGHRVPEVAVPAPELMGLRTSADRPHRRKVPLRRLSAVHQLGTARGLSTLGS